VLDPKDSFYDGFVTTFLSAHGELKVTQEQRREALALCQQAGNKAALACMAAFTNTDFRDDLAKVGVPALILHGDADATVPFEGSGQRTHAAIPGSELHLIAGAPTAAMSVTPVNGTAPCSTSPPGSSGA
jgi:pimeloyl-ACP methyl ester carboxylesterase